MRSFATFPDGYELIDAGNNLKLESWNGVVTIRPEHQAYFKPAKTIQSWRDQAHWEFLPVSPGALTGSWNRLKNDAPDSWLFQNKGITALLTPSGNKHLGIFPEQNFNWEIIAGSENCAKFLNLFAYTGFSSLVARNAGMDVVHVDSVRAIIDSARRNMELSGLAGIRWAVEDAFKFVAREINRGNSYDMIQLDPPAFGLGTKGRKWKLETQIHPLISDCYQLLKPGGRMIVSTYSPRIELKDLEAIVTALPNLRDKLVTELWMKTSTGKELYYGLVGQILKG